MGNLKKETKKITLVTMYQHKDTIHANHASLPLENKSSLTLKSLSSDHLPPLMPVLAIMQKTRSKSAEKKGAQECRQSDLVDLISDVDTEYQNDYGLLRYADDTLSIISRTSEPVEPLEEE